MAKSKRAPFLKRIATAAETLGLEAMPIIASIGQETGLGASLPEKTKRRKKRVVVKKKAKAKRR